MTSNYLLKSIESPERSWNKSEFILINRGQYNRNPDKKGLWGNAPKTNGYSLDDISMTLSFIDNPTENISYKDYLQIVEIYDKDEKNKWINRLISKTEKLNPQQLELILLTKVNCPEYSYYKAVLKDKNNKLHFRGCTTENILALEPEKREGRTSFVDSHETGWYSDHSKMSAIPAFWKKIKEILSV